MAYEPAPWHNPKRKPAKPSKREVQDRKDLAHAVAFQVFWQRTRFEIVRQVYPTLPEAREAMAVLEASAPPGRKPCIYGIVPGLGPGGLRTIFVPAAYMPGE
jgi:hypothetical protein